MDAVQRDVPHGASATDGTEHTPAACTAPVALHTTYCDGGATAALGWLLLGVVTQGPVDAKTGALANDVAEDESSGGAGAVTIEFLSRVADVMSVRCSGPHCVADTVIPALRAALAAPPDAPASKRLAMSHGPRNAASSPPEAKKRRPRRRQGVIELEQGEHLQRVAAATMRQVDMVLGQLDHVACPPWSKPSTPPLCAAAWQHFAWHLSAMLTEVRAAVLTARYTDCVAVVADGHWP